ncbi:MAG: exosortase/archaeosortase family protein [Akkermansiaceae bacterium]
MNPRQTTNLCILLSFIPSYIWYANRMMHGGEEALSIILIPLVIYFAINTPRTQRNSNWLSLLGLTLYSIFWLLHLPATIKATLAITTLLHHFGLLRNFGLSALAYLSLPWLSSLQFFLGYPLRKLVTQLSGSLLNSIGYNVEADGTGLIYQSQQVFVDPPCSGINMLCAGITLSAILCVFFKLTWKKGIILFSTTTLIMILINALRGCILFFPESNLVHWPDWTHIGVGIALYTLCLTLLISLTQKLSANHA